MCKKNYIWNPVTCSFKNGKYVESFIVNSVITCDKVIDAVTKLYDKEIKSLLIKVTLTNF